jgi:hypothetical protein
MEQAVIATLPTSTRRLLRTTQAAGYLWFANSPSASKTLPCNALHLGLYASEGSCFAKPGPETMLQFLPRQQINVHLT